MASTETIHLANDRWELRPDRSREPLELGHEHVQPEASVWRWLERAGCRDLRDARVMGSESPSAEHPALTWWLDEARVEALWQVIDGTVDAYLEAQADRALAYSPIGRKAGACLQRLIERVPDAALDWCRRACAHWPTRDAQPFDDDRPLWAWHEFGVEAVVDCLGTHAPECLPAIWCHWFDVARTPAQRHWVLQHVGDRATGPVRPDMGLAAETLRALLMRAYDDGDRQ